MGPKKCDSTEESASGGKVFAPGCASKAGRWSRWGARRTQVKSSFRLTDGHKLFEKCWIGGKAPKIQESSCSPRWYCKRQLWFLCSIHRTRIVSITNDSGKSHGYNFQTAGLRRTSSGRSICLYPGKNGRRFKITENSQTRMSRYLDSSTTTQMAKIMVQYGRPSRSSWVQSLWSSFGRTVMGKTIWENPIKIRLGEGFQLGMLIRTPWKRVLEGNKTLIRCGKHSIKKLIWENQHLSLIRLSGVHSKTMWNKQRYCGQLQSHVWIANFSGWNRKTSIPSVFSCFFMVLWCGRSSQEVRRKMLWLASRTTQQLCKVSTPCLDDHHFKEEELKSVGELSHVYSQIVLKCLYLARIGRPDNLWSVNKLARSITKWTRACDKRLYRLISYIHHTCEYKQLCYVGNTAKQCRLGLFQDSDFAGDLEDSKSTSSGTLCVFGSHAFVPTSWMCEKQTSVSHSSTESEIISLDSGLRLDGIPALDLWDLKDSPWKHDSEPW